MADTYSSSASKAMPRVAAYAAAQRYARTEWFSSAAE